MSGKTVATIFLFLVGLIASPANAQPCGGWGCRTPARSGREVATPLYLYFPVQISRVPVIPPAAQPLSGQPTTPAPASKPTTLPTVRPDTVQATPQPVPPPGAGVSAQGQVHKTPAAVAGSSVQVQVVESHGRCRCGSGTLVKLRDGRVIVLTAKHVVPQQGTIYFWFQPVKQGGPVRWLRGRFLSCDAAADLSVLGFDGPVPEGATAVSISAEEAKPGATVWQVGYPGTVRTERNGIAVADETYTYGVRNAAFRLTSPTRPGDSGSGLISDRMELCGVGWGGDAVVRAVGVADIRRHLREALGEE